jgi:DNA-binding SARP family transcriptional activator/tetratricopeptide (TPR) repeat protein
MALELRVLGEIAARIDGRSLDLGHLRRRCVLAGLAVEANQVVPTDELIGRVWGPQPVRNARRSLYSYLTRLRRVLAETEVTVEHRPGGYALVVDPTVVDLHRFHQLLAQARTVQDERAASRMFAQALELWRGEPFAGVNAPWFDAMRVTLRQERFAAELDYTDLRLRAGEHARLVPELAARAAEYPLDERLTGQLMVALYRVGRQADALRHYRRIRRRLAEEIGADPGPALRDVHQQILTNAPVLAGATDGPARAPTPVPRQLPARPALFTGRQHELDQLSNANATIRSPGTGTPTAATLVITAIGGAAGIGKTWLALQWAHQHVDQFPDGQLYVDLRGFDPSGPPTPAVVAVRGFLDALGVDPAGLPIEADAQAALYRSIVADRRMLIVLDNARDAAQIIPLLPGSTSCTVVITSRRQLTGLAATHGINMVDMDVLAEPEARELLARRLSPERLAAEPEAVADLLDFCAGLPLALGIVAARLAQHRDFPVATMAEELRDTSVRLAALDAGDRRSNVRVVLSCSYCTLDADTATVFWLLGLAPGPDIGLPGASALAALPVSRTREVLRELEDASLIRQYRPGRFRMHDLIRLYAVEQGRDALRAEAWEAALRRLTDFYLHTAHNGGRHMDPNRTPLELPPPAVGSHPQPLSDTATAFAWFDTEHACLLAVHREAAARGWHHTVCQLAWTVTAFHGRRGHLHDDLATWRSTVASADRIDDPVLRIVTYKYLGHALARTGHSGPAVQHLERALALARAAQDRTQQALTHRALAWAWERRGDDRQALAHATHALHLFRALDQRAGEAVALNSVGWYLARLGQYEQAREHCRASLALHRSHHNRAGEATALDSLGYIDHHTGRFTLAIDHYQQALTLRRALGYTYSLADTLDAIGHTYLALDKLEQARAVWQEALDSYRTQRRDADATRVRRQLDSLERQTAPMRW